MTIHIKTHVIDDWANHWLSQRQDRVTLQGMDKQHWLSPRHDRAGQDRRGHTMIGHVRTGHDKTWQGRTYR